MYDENSQLGHAAFLRICNNISKVVKLWNDELERKKQKTTWANHRIKRHNTLHVNIGALANLAIFPFE